MPLIWADRVKETTTTTGTGAFTLGGAATGFQAFSAVMANADTCYYSVNAPGGSEWEVGLGTYTSSGNTLTRTTVLASSNSGNAVNFSAGVKDIFLTSAAAWVNTRAASGANSDITSLSGLTTALSVAQGGTGATTAANARTNLAAAGSGAVTGSGLTMAAARILGRTTAATGAIEELPSIPVSLGGTGATDAGTARTNLGLGTAATMVGPTGVIVGTTDTQTVTNKRVNPRIGTVASAATITPTADTADQYNITALATAATIAAPSGTPVDGQRLILRFEDNGTGRALTWTTSSGAYRAVGVTLPTTTVANRVTYVGCVYNAQDVFWDVVAAVTQA